MGIYNSKWKLNTRHHRNLFNFIKFAFKGLKVITRWHAQGRVSHIDVVFMELQQLLKEHQVHEHPAWGTGLSLKRLIRNCILTAAEILLIHDTATLFPFLVRLFRQLITSSFFDLLLILIGEDYVTRLRGGM